eukprot:3937024-Rhodomonas_salina.1
MSSALNSMRGPATNSSAETRLSRVWNALICTGALYRVIEVFKRLFLVSFGGIQAAYYKAVEAASYHPPPCSTTLHPLPFTLNTSPFTLTLAVILLTILEMRCQLSPTTMLNDLRHTLSQYRTSVAPYAISVLLLPSRALAPYRTIPSPTHTHTHS